MQVVGLEPTQSVDYCPLKTARLPFRHTCLLALLFIITRYARLSIVNFAILVDNHYLLDTYLTIALRTPIPCVTIKTKLFKYLRRKEKVDYSIKNWMKTFKHGTDVKHRKYTHELAIKPIEPPKMLSIPLRQHIGASATPTVKVGELIKKGQKIGEAQGFVSASIHSSVSGKVKKITEIDLLGMTTQVVQIENDYEYEWDESIKPIGTVDELEGIEIQKMLASSGIVGMGGAGFPTHVKLSPPKDKKVDLLIINGAECEPYLTTDHRQMLEQGDKLIGGIHYLMKCLGVSKTIIGVEENKKDAIEVLEKLIVNDPSISIVGLKVKYPQGAEKQLIYATSRRIVPAGSLPLEVGVVVNNVATTIAIYEYFMTGRPLVERVLTVTGQAIEKPGNYFVPVGMSISDLVEACGGTKETLYKVISGGPMMGKGVSSLDIPITKTTSGLLFLDRQEAPELKVLPCIKCSKCVSVCPMFLQPINISQTALVGRYDLAEDFHAMDCVECGACSYICPANRPLVHTIRMAKNQIMLKNR